MTHEWKQTGETGVICYGDTGFIAYYEPKAKIFWWRAPNGKQGYSQTLAFAKMQAERFYREMQELGLTLS